MACPPRSAAVSAENAPERRPMGVRADETMTEPGMANPPREDRQRRTTSYRMVASRPVGDSAVGGPGEELRSIRDAIIAGVPADDLAALPLPGTYRGAVVRAD